MINKILSLLGFEILQPVLQSSFKVLIIRSVSVLLLMLYTIFLARNMSQADFGLFMYAWVILRFIPPILSLGYTQAAMKFGAVYRKKGDYGLLRGLITTSRIVGLAFAFGVLVFVLILKISGLLDTESETGKAIFLSSMVLPIGVLLVIHREYQRGLRLLGKGLMGYFLLRPGFSLILTIIAALWIDLTAETAILIYAVALFLILPIDLRNIANVIGTKGKVAYERDKWKVVAHPIFLMLLMQAILNRTDIMLVGSMLNMEATAIYSAAIRLAVLITFLLDAIRISISPMLSELYHDGDFKGMERRIQLSTKMLTVISLPAGIIMIVFSKFFLGLFGEAYIQGNAILIVLVVGQVFQACVGPTTMVMTMTNLQRHASVMVMIFATLNMGLTFIFIKLWGALGAAVATTSMMILWKSGEMILIKRKLGISVFKIPGVLSMKRTSN